ncbi:MAG: HEAT repeat protein [Myxococcota bacterium]|jgi:HEAT repeat protein
MSLEAVFVEARKKRDPFWQLVAIKENRPPKIALGDLLWQALREGAFQPGPSGYFNDLKAAPGGFDATDLLKLFSGIADNPGAAAALNTSWRQGNSGFIFRGLQGLLGAVRGGIGPLILRWKEADERLRPVLGYILFSDGRISAADLEPGTLSWVVWSAVSTKNDSGYLEKLLAHRQAVWSDAVWGRAVGKATEEVTQDIEDYSVIGPAQEHLTDVQLMHVALHRMDRKHADESATILRARGETSLPSLHALAEHWLDDRSANGRNGSSLNILMTAIIGIHLDLGRPPLEPRLDLLLRHAMWTAGGPLLSVLSAIPEDRLQVLLLTPDFMPSYPYTYAHLCPTPAVQQHLVDCVVGLLGRAHWAESHDLPEAIVRLGEPMVSRICAALEKGGGLHRHLLLDCLVKLGDSRGIAPLVRAFGDTGPRVESETKTVNDIPEIAVKGLAQLAQVVPEAEVLAALQGALSDSDAGVRGCAIAVLVSMTPSAATLALAKTAAASESDPVTRSALGRLLWHLEAPEAVQALRTVPVPPQLAVLWPRRWDKEHRAAHLPAVLAVGPAVMVHWVGRVRRMMVDESSTFFGVWDVWAEILSVHADHPATGWLTLSLLSLAPANDHYEHSKLAEQLEALAETLPMLPEQWLALVRSPARPRSPWMTLWLSDARLVGADDLLCEALSDANEEVRAQALKRLLERPDSDPTAALPLLASKDKAIRLVVASLLQQCPRPAAIPHLQAARKKERAKANKAALDQALAAYTPEQLAAAKPLAPVKKTRAKKKSAPTTPRAIWTDWLKGAPLADPGAITWNALAIRIEQHPPLESEVALIDAALAHWPDTLRTAPESWLIASSRRKKPPAYWSLARTVHYRHISGPTPVNLTVSKIRWLLTSPSMTGIRHLTLQGYDKLSGALLEGLASSSVLSELQTLDLKSCGLGLSGLRAVAEATWLTKLECLNLDHRFFMQSWSRHEPEAAVLLRGAAHLSKLCDLRLNLLAGEELLEAVLTAPHLAGVTTLHLGGSSCSDALLCEMAVDPRRWRDLDLSGRSLTSAGVRALADALNVDTLERLVLSGPIGTEGVLALLSSDRLPALDYLVLHGTDVTDADASRVKSHSRPGQLSHFMCGSGKLSKSIVVSKS